MPAHIALVAAAAAAAFALVEYEFPLHGGTGGTGSYDLTCGDGAVLVGVTGRRGQWLDQLRARCVRVAVDGSWSGAPFTQGTAGGTTGTAFGPLDCPAGSAVASVRGRHGWYIHELSLACYDLAAGASINGNAVRTLTAGASGGDRTWSWELCPGAKPAKGFRGRDGAFVDRIQLVCHSGSGSPTTVAVVPGATRLIGPASGTTLTTLQPGFTWGVVTYATRYQICIRREGSSACDMVSETTAGLRSRLTPGQLSFRPASDLQFGTARRGNWSVRACSDAGCGPWPTSWWINAPATVSFAAGMAPSFRHERCMNCHAVAATNFQPGAGGLPAAHVAVTASTNCAVSGCHTTALQPAGTVDPGWHAPAAGSDLRNKTDAQLCQMARDRGTVAPSTLAHLTQDRLILWAVGDGRVPNKTLPTAPPNSIATWRDRVQSWINAGMPCS